MKRAAVGRSFRYGSLERALGVAVIAGLLACPEPARAQSGPVGQPTVTLLHGDGTQSRNRFDLVIVGDGYQTDSPAWLEDVTRFVGRSTGGVLTAAGLFGVQPFATYLPYFNVWRVDAWSAGSGLDTPPAPAPGAATDCVDETPESGAPCVDTAFDSYAIPGDRRIVLDQGGYERLDALLDTLLSDEQRDAVLLLVNTDRYGGSGGTTAQPVAIFSGHNEWSVAAMLHEIGHLVGDLGDEYPGTGECLSTGAGILGDRINLMTAPPRWDVTSLPWARWVTGTPSPLPVPFGPSNPDGAAVAASGDTIPETTAPIYSAYAGGGACDRVFRSTQTSRMRRIDAPFHAVNAEQLVRRFYGDPGGRKVQLAFAPQPSPGTAIGLTAGQSTTLSIAPPPAAGRRVVRWRVGGIEQTGQSGPAFTFSTTGRAAGTYPVQVDILDDNAFVHGSLRSQPPAREVVSWNVVVSNPSTTTLVAETFDDGVANGWTVVSGSFTVATDGASLAYRTTAGLSRSVVGQTAWTNYTVSARIKARSWSSTGNRSAAVMVRYKDTNNYFLLGQLANNELRISKKLGGTLTTKARKAFTFTPGTWYTVKVVVDGSRYSLFVDGTLQLSYADSGTLIGNGKVGVLSDAGAVSFDDFVATTP